MAQASIARRALGGQRRIGMICKKTINRLLMLAELIDQDISK